jgi:glutathione synthase/RimK-type ligase-like ATP-grasp enzyme
VALATDVTLATCAEFSELSPEDAVLRAALEARGASVRAAKWDDPAIDWSLSGITVVRSTWDYHLRVEAFAQWLHRIDSVTRLVNPLPVMLDNLHKRYLERLETRGVPIVPSLFVDVGVRLDLAAISREHGWDDVVVKPCVASSAFGAGRFTGNAIGSSGQAHLDDLLERGDVMVQRYEAAVETAGERAMIFLGGTFSHAMRKVPFSGGQVGGRLDRAVVGEDEIALGHVALATLDDVPDYARVDIVPSQGGPLLMELELVEPALYFEVVPEAAPRLAALILRAL